MSRSIRLLPGIFIAIALLIFRYVIPLVSQSESAAMLSVFGGLLGGVAVLVWWSAFSRAPWKLRLTGVLAFIITPVVTAVLVHPSIGTGMQGVMFPMLAVPTLSICFVLWAAMSPRLTSTMKYASLAAAVIIGVGMWTLFRSDGITGIAGVDLRWRWAATEEAILLADGRNVVGAAAVDPALIRPGTWPGFRGAFRDGIVHGTSFSTDWEKSQPKELWRGPVGPGCGSFAVRDGRFYTQEQRGEDEAVTCYDLPTGKLVWMHADKARFYDSHAGAGPRGTPTLHDSVVYTLGATGVLNALRMKDGSVIWNRNAATDNGVAIPGWGVASSPLVEGDVLLVATVGRLAAYDRHSGTLLWQGKDGEHSYSSPHRILRGSVVQVVHANRAGYTGYRPADGTVLWEYPLEGERIIQPTLLPDGDMLFDTPAKSLHRVAVGRNGDRWDVTEKWSTEALRPNFNDQVAHEGYVYGFMGRRIICVNLGNGDRMWRGGNYGGQMLLLADQSVLLVLTEKGGLALVEADPAGFVELARMPAITGKTWNHPVVAGNVLLVRNAKEMAAFVLPTQQDTLL